MARPGLPQSAAAFALVLAAAAAASGCQRETTPPLIQVTSLSPREVEEGDRLTVAGVGFPEGKLAHVSFRGDLHRPGVAPVEGVAIDVEAVVGSPTGVEIPVNPALARLFVGSGDRASHTTFSGDVTVAFAASTPAAPPVAGTLHDTWLDLRPPTPHRALADADAAEGERTLAFLGIEPHRDPVASGGILVDAIASGSHAESARLLPGDVITELDGLRVLSLRDLITRPGARGAWLKIRRNGTVHEEPARVPLLGFKPPPAAAMLGPVTLLGVVAAWILLFFAPVPGVVVWLERALALRLLAGSSGREAGDSGRRDRFGRKVTQLAGSLRAAAVALLGVTSTLVLLPFIHDTGLGELDAGLLFLGSLTALTTLAVLAPPGPLASGGTRRGRPAWRAILSAPGRVLTFALPAAAALVAAVITAGSFRFDDLVRTQGGAPWAWSACKSPAGLPLLAAAWIAAFASLPHDDAAETWLPAARPPTTPAPHVELGPRTRLFALASWAHVIALSTLGVAVFLGGWQVPGLAPEQLESHPGLMLLGGVIFAGKTWVVVASFAAARWSLPALRGLLTVSLAWRWLIPSSLLALLLDVAWVAWGPGPGVEALVGAVSAGTVVAVFGHVVVRVRQVATLPAPALDPFV
jgi:NADH-quinone oxidoreductase subunit H